MTTSIKISDKSKKILDRLQAKITLEMDKKPTLQEITDTIIEIIDKNEELIIKQLEKAAPSLGKDEIENIIRFPWSFGVKTSEEEIDKILYED